MFLTCFQYIPFIYTMLNHPLYDERKQKQVTCNLMFNQLLNLMQSVFVFCGLNLKEVPYQIVFFNSNQY